MTQLRNIYITDPITGDVASLDNMTASLSVIDYNDHMVHIGNAYTAEISTDNGASLNIAFKTPDSTERAHIIIGFTCEEKAHMELTEGATWTTNTGTVYAPINQRRDSANESMLLEDKTATPDFTEGGVLTGVTGISGGNVIRTLYIFSGKDTGAETFGKAVLVLDPGETYVAVLTSDNGGTQGLQLRLEWYEHTDIS